MQIPKIVFFDAAGTLLHVPRGVGAHYREVAQRHGWDPEAESLQRAFRVVFRDLPAPATTCVAREDDDRGWWQTLVSHVLDMAGAPDGFPREEYFDEVYAEFVRPGVWELYPEVREVLEALAGRFRLGILSNFDGRLRTVLAHFGLLNHFEVVAISSEVGADKPDPWIFSRALEMAGVSASEALLAGDDPEADWAGAEQAGWQVFRLERPGNSLRGLLPVLGV